MPSFDCEDVLVADEIKLAKEPESQRVGVDLHAQHSGARKREPEQQSNRARERKGDYWGADGKGGRDAEMVVKVQIPSGATVRSYQYQ